MFLSPNPGDLVQGLIDYLGSNDSSSKSAPQYGDVIYVQRFAYKHFAIYIGNKRVIHYAHDVNGVLCIHEAPLSEFLESETEFYSCNFPEEYSAPLAISLHRNMNASPFFSFLGMWLQYNKRSKYHLYSPSETVKRAIGRLGETEYNLFLNNCEHFALWCKTGIHESRQVEVMLECVPKIMFNA